MSDTLTALDATFLELEQHDEGALMHIGGVSVFDPIPGGGAPTVDELCEDLSARLTQLPRYAQRLSSTRTGGLAWPHWTDDDRFHVRDHVAHVSLPAPGGYPELCDWAADFYSHRLDRTRPLWEMALIEGLPNGRWAIAHKTHHCLVDGVGSVDVAYLLLDAEANPPERPTAPVAPPDDGPPLRPFLPGPPPPIAYAAHTGAEVARAGLHAALHPREVLERSRSLAEVIVRDELIGAPHTSLNVPIGSTRRFAVLSRPLADFKAIRRGFGGSLNDAVLAVCTSGLRRLLIERDEQLPSRGLRAMVPMNVRQSSERLMLGNRISSLFVELPVATADPYERHRRIVAATERLKSSGAATGAAAILDLAALAPPVLHAGLARSLYATRLFNVTITNVPGPQIPLYALGARLREVHPVVPLAAAHSVGIAIFSYDGLVTFGVIADSDSTPDIDVLARGIEEGIEELLAPVRKQNRRAKVARGTS
ncbi:MAG TPA: wax ester/triacylglycerol synthase family O-acyltransferase [Solirubrobacteraceae bacterium]|nr:wax ester/triacylglycerol synthase family O-acyltransferase [Solirubrobacteraceae bacterium]